MISDRNTVHGIQYNIIRRQENLSWLPVASVKSNDIDFTTMLAKLKSNNEANKYFYEI